MYLFRLMLCSFFFSSACYSHGEADQSSISVSMIQLIANPENYNQKKIRVIGAGQLQFEGDKICTHMDDLKYHISKNCLSMSLNIKEIDHPFKKLADYNGEYILIEGTFIADEFGHMGSTSGAIKNITRYQLWVL